ncbi:MAG: nitroreductase [Gammaproteobacteria bacterium]|nr:nitroreductase [Gammaproteobacteria bacterium]
MRKAPSYETQELREFAETLRGRRTINLYLQMPVPEGLVHEAIEAATWAPNHHVTEPWHFFLLGEQAIEKSLDLCHDIVRARKGENAADFKRENWSEKPGWLVVSCAKSEDEILQREDYASCATAIQNFTLYLWKAGVGSKWTTGPITRDPRFLEIVGIDESEAFVVGLVWYGYPKVTPAQSRKGLEEVLSELP